MSARGYEFYLRVLKVSLTSERSDDDDGDDGGKDVDVIVYTQIYSNKNCKSRYQNAIIFSYGH